VRFTGFATVTAGGGGPACCLRSPQLATKVAIANTKTSLGALRINENDETSCVGFMNSCSGNVDLIIVVCPIALALSYVQSAHSAIAGKATF
jgi:hypothetical protein